MPDNGSPTLRFFQGRTLDRAKLRQLIALQRELDRTEDEYDRPYGVTLKKYPDSVIRRWIRGSHGYTADVGGKPVGMVFGGMSGDYADTGSISGLVVAPEYRGRGIGRQLLRKMILDNVRNKRKTLLRVHNNNPAARALYESEGFKPVSTVMLRDEKKASFAKKVASVLRKVAAPAVTAALATAPTPARGAYPGSLNNPGNMRDYGIKWKGAVRPGSNYGGFIRFDTPQNGARAVSRNLLTLGTKRGIPFTLNDVMAKYSPKTENNLSRHVKNISAISDLPPDKVLDPKNTGQMVDLLRGVIGAESGQKTLDWFRPVELTNAVLRARQP